MAYSAVFLGLLFHFFVSGSTEGDKKCYHAKICVHNNREKCGVSHEGLFRRFFDSCDIKEYNCLKNTDFVKTSIDKCSHLPPLEPAENVSETAPGQEEQQDPEAPRDIARQRPSASKTNSKSRSDKPKKT